MAKRHRYSLLFNCILFMLILGFFIKIGLVVSTVVAVILAIAVFSRLKL